MQTEKIYHYTSVESLALILSYRTIRFTRLDQVDDVTEAQTHANIQFGKYLFASCWTQEEADNIAQWKMYGADMMGVRIELPNYPFRRLTIDDTSYLRLSGDRTSPLSNSDLYGKTYFVSPPLTEGMGFGGPVEYVSDVTAEYAAAVSPYTDEGGNPAVWISNVPRLARLKSNIWEFQAEYRFFLQVLPISPGSSTDGPLLEPTPGQVAAAWANMREGRDPGITYFDVPIDPNILDQMVIRIGPLCTPGGRRCVEALAKTFAPNARVEESPLTGNIRRRG